MWFAEWWSRVAPSPSWMKTRLPIALVFFVSTTWLMAELHEGTYGFSQRTTARKHLTLHSEQAFYLSYFFDTINAADPVKAFAGLVTDTGSEYPHVINVRSLRMAALVRVLTAVVWDHRPCIDSTFILSLHLGFFIGC